MAKHLWSIVCRQAVVDRYSNTLSLFEVVEDVHIKLRAEVSEPLQAAVDFFVVSLWTRDDIDREEKERGIQRLRFLSPKRKSIGVMEQSFEFADSITRARNIFNVRGMPVRESGCYVIQTQIRIAARRWRTVSEIPVRVSLELAPYEFVTKKTEH